MAASSLELETPQKRRQPSKILFLLQAIPAASLPMVAWEEKEARTLLQLVEAQNTCIGELSEERSKGEETLPVKKK